MRRLIQFPVKASFCQHVCFQNRPTFSESSGTHAISRCVSQRQHSYGDGNDVASLWVVYVKLLLTSNREEKIKTVL